jgi:hypothetical protein
MNRLSWPEDGPAHLPSMDVPPAKAPAPAVRAMPSYVREPWEEALVEIAKIRELVAAEVRTQAEGIDPRDLGERLLAIMVAEAIDQRTQARLPHYLHRVFCNAAQYSDGPRHAIGEPVREAVNAACKQIGMPKGCL